MASKIDVKSGDPYRGDGGQFGTSPIQKLEDSLHALEGKTFVPKGGNDKKVAALHDEAASKLASVRGATVDDGKTDEAKLSASIDGVAQEIKDQPKEYLSVLNPQGQTIHRDSGDDNNVGGTLESLSGLVGKNVTAVHNHPGSPGRPTPSSGDLATAAYLKADRLVVVTSDTKAIITPQKKNKWIGYAVKDKDSWVDASGDFDRADHSDIDIFDTETRKAMKADPNYKAKQDFAAVAKKFNLNVQYVPVDEPTPSMPQKDDKKNRLAEIKDSIDRIMKLQAEQGGLTTPQAKEFEALSQERAGIRFDTHKPVDESKVATGKEAMSTLTPHIVATAVEDRFSNRAAYDAINKAVSGVYHNADTPVDDIMNGKDKDITPAEFYNTFANTRAELTKEFGKDMTLYRSVGEQKSKYTTNWATTREFAGLFGGNIAEKKFPVKDVIAVNATPNGKYHELIMGKPPVDGTNDNALRGQSLNANITPDQQRQIDLAAEQFKQSVQRVDNQVLAQYVQAIQNGNYAEAEAILENAEQSQQTHTLEFALLTIGAILLPLYAKQRLQSLFTQFGLHTVFAQTDSAEKSLKEQAQKGAESHVHTIAKDLKKSLDDAIDSEITTPAVEAAVKDKFEKVADKNGPDYVRAVKGDQEIYKYARDLILAGDSRQSVIKKLQENFSEVGKRRATVIAGNEANRVFTVSQLDADAQFLAQNKLTSKAYKKLVSNTGTPEAICKAIIDATAIKPIPFNNDFLPFGKEFVVKTEVGGKARTLRFTPNYEHLKSGHIHVNCHCRYELLIKNDDGSFNNTNTGKVENFFDFDSEDREEPDNPNCRCCDGKGEHDTGRECYGCDATGLDANYEGPNPCAGVTDDNDFKPDLHPRDPVGKFAKKPTIGHTILDLSKLRSNKDFDYAVDHFDGTYTQEQVTASKIYQSHWGYEVNDAFRFDKKNIKMNDKVISTDKFAKVFDTTFNMTISDESVLYRGVSNSPSDFVPGKNYLDKGYMSTSTVEDTARHKFMPPGGSLIRLTVPAGQKASVPDIISGVTPLDEQEVLLPRGSSYSVYKVEGDIVYAVAV